MLTFYKDLGFVESWLKMTNPKNNIDNLNFNQIMFVGIEDYCLCLEMSVLIKHQSIRD
jgi:hypothetical protein